MKVRKVKNAAGQSMATFQCSKRDLANMAEEAAMFCRNKAKTTSKKDYYLRKARKYENALELLQTPSSQLTHGDIYRF